MIINKLLHANEEQLKALLLNHSCFYPFHFKSGESYLFFFKNKIYGIYTFLQTKDNIHYFKHNNYTPCYYYSSSKLDIKLAHYLIRQENKADIKLSLIISKEDNNIHFLWHSLYDVHLISKHSISIDKEIQNMINFYNQLDNNPFNQALYEKLKDYGKYLYNNLPSELKKLIQISTSVSVNGNFSSIFYYLFEGEIFISLKKGIEEHIPKQINNTNTVLNETINYKLLFNQYEKDVYMQQEYDNVKQQFNSAGIPLSSVFSTLTKSSFSKHLESSDFLHYIGHSDNNGILLNKETYYTVEDFKKLSTIPKVLILSSCHGVNKEFRETFFNLGGELLIYFNKSINSQFMETSFDSFYWQLFFRRAKIEEIVLSIRRKLAKKNLNWLYLRVMGNTTLRFESK